MMEKMEEEEEVRKPVMFLGRDLTRMPCIRESFLYGISSGVGAGLLAFLFTSRPQLSSSVAMGSYCLVTLSVWIYCRHNHAVEKFTHGQLKEFMHQAVAMEGTEKGLALEKHKELDDV